jgi:electron transport complex protein RnfE
MKIKQIAMDGVVKQNPVFRLVLGTCPTLAITTTLTNAVGMGAAVTLVLIFSNMLISLLRKFIPDKVRIPCFILIIATFVTLVTMAVEKFLPALYESLGLFLPLIVVNCIILARAESFASVNKVGHSVLDGLFMGAGYTLGIMVLSFVRELLGAGALFGVELWNFRIAFFAAPAGAFFTYGVLIAVFNSIFNRIEKKNREKQYDLAKTQLSQAKSEVTEVANA